MAKFTADPAAALAMINQLSLETKRLYPVAMKTEYCEMFAEGIMKHSTALKKTVGALDNIVMGMKYNASATPALVKHLQKLQTDHERIMDFAAPLIADCWLPPVLRKAPSLADVYIGPPRWRSARAHARARGWKRLTRLGAQCPINDLFDLI